MATKAAQDKLNKPLAFETTDPRGHVVICAQSTWDTHILRRPEMGGRLDDVKATVNDPDGIRESTARDEAQIYERVCGDSVQIRVVATFDQIEIVTSGTGTSTARVNTAFPVQADIYDKPQVGDYIYKRPSKKQKEGEE